MKKKETCKLNDNIEQEYLNANQELDNVINQSVRMKEKLIELEVIKKIIQEWNKKIIDMEETFSSIPQELIAAQDIELKEINSNIE